eukprot:5741235-Prymnesium_polylepis.1
MEDAWATPLPSRTLLLVEARAEPQPLLAFRGIRCGPHTTFARLMCASHVPPEDSADGLCELCERCAREGCLDHQPAVAARARLWPCCSPRASMCGRL